MIIYSISSLIVAENQLFELPPLVVNIWLAQNIIKYSLSKFCKPVFHILDFLIYFMCNFYGKKNLSSIKKNQARAYINKQTWLFDGEVQLSKQWSLFWGIDVVGVIVRRRKRCKGSFKVFESLEVERYPPHPKHIGFLR